MIEGSRRLPLRHISIRVPWHDTGWDGRVCQNPRGNAHCLALRRIGQSRDDVAETEHKGEFWDEDGQWLPACADERGGFLSERGYIRRVNHPYAWQAKYKHFRETQFQHKPFSAAPIPFGWMLRNSDGVAPEAVEQYDLGFVEEYEPNLENFTSRWVQERRNQLVLLDTFFGSLKPKESLVFFYAKKTPLSEDPKRVIVGIGRVMEIESHVEYKYAEDSDKDQLRCVLWERNIRHSIRPTLTDGFILPYHELLKKSEHDPDFDLTPYTLHVPEEFWDAFSMGAEHVSHDQAVSVLVSAARVVEKIKAVVAGDWGKVSDWIDEQLNRIWSLRGAYPGLGSALAACNIPNGNLVAYAIGEMLSKSPSANGDPWPLVDRVIREPKLLPDDLGKSLGPNAVRLWDSLKATNRILLLKLLSRFELTEAQARRWYDSERKSKSGIDLTDSQIIANPYLLFEGDRLNENPVPFGTIDRGIFPEGKIQTEHPIPSPSACNEPQDPRRGRALAIKILEEAAIAEGHTLLPQSWLTSRTERADIRPQCAITADWILAFARDLAPEIVPCALTDATPAWQLQRYNSLREIIKTDIKKRLTAKLHGGAHDWRKLIDARLPPIENAADKEREQRARSEKARALEVVFRHRFSVLIGPAGTGKTTLLSALLSIPAVKNGGVLLLAPTGKARVQIQKHASGASASTLAQFLMEYGRYAAETQRYRVTFSANREKAFRTVIIDESSMLTEEQLAATFDALSAQSVERIIMVGDPRQLPPIGAGRPFVDIISFLESLADEVKKTPLPGYAELKVLCRQSNAVGPEKGDSVPAKWLDDVTLAQWFGSDAPDAGADEVWDRLKAGETKRVELVEWETPTDLQEKLVARVKSEVRQIAVSLGHKERTDEENLEISFGGVPYQHGGIFFNPTYVTKEGVTKVGAGAASERWQILSPIRGGEAGVESINRRIQKDFRKRAQRVAMPERPWLRKTAKPLGPQGILYGDKVINVSNTSWRKVFPKKKPYVANGEIGVVVGQYQSKFVPKPWKHEVEFSTQTGFKYDYGNSDFGEDGEAPLELAYALTIHKSQGSEFDITFVVIPNPCRLLSRELLYTALTRQKHRIVLFHQGDVRRLINLSTADNSETARRLTNLFVDPNPFEHGKKFLDGRLVHRTSSGKLVRSKSEVIVADILERLGIEYEYELRFDGNDGTFRSPDFTINDAASGTCVLIEHLGMLDDPEYKNRWEKKLKWYRANGVCLIGEGEGERAVLVTTTELGGIDKPKIEALFREVFGL